MKKILLLFLMYILGFSLQAQNPKGTPKGKSDYYQQNTDYALSTAGEYLKKHSRQYYLGTGMMIGGYVLIVASINSQSSELITIGSLASIAGLVVQIISHKHIGKAGEILKNSAITRHVKVQGASEGIGLGLAYSF